jgi:ubiquinone biosynthesis protein COQ4
MSAKQVNSLETMLSKAYQLYQGVRILKSPEDLTPVLKLSNSLLNQATQSELAEFSDKIRWTPEAVAAIESRYRLVIPNLTELMMFPKGTLGHEFAQYLHYENIDPRDISTPPVDDDLSYVAAHLAETHDLWHLLTGFASDLDGEAGLAAFAAAQYGSPFQYSIVAGTLLIGLQRAPWALASRMTAITKGWQMGLNSYPLLGVRWGEDWETPLERLKARFLLADNY